MSQCGAQMEPIEPDSGKESDCENNHECILEEHTDGFHECVCGEQWEELGT
jgi:hypothetical protein